MTHRLKVIQVVLLLEFIELLQCALILGGTQLDLFGIVEYLDVILCFGKMQLDLEVGGKAREGVAIEWFGRESVVEEGAFIAVGTD